MKSGQWSVVREEFLDVFAAESQVFDEIAPGVRRGGSRGGVGQCGLRHRWGDGSRGLGCGPFGGLGFGCASDSLMGHLLKKVEKKKKRKREKVFLGEREGGVRRGTHGASNAKKRSPVRRGAHRCSLPGRIK